MGHPIQFQTSDNNVPDFNLNKLQRFIISLMEEAGEEDLVTLINSSIEANGNLLEIQALEEALKGLIVARLVEISSYDNSKNAWASISLENGLAYIENALPQFTWNKHKNLWTIEDTPELKQIILTDDGLVLSSRILNEDGWPNEKIRLRSNGSE